MIEKMFKGKIPNSAFCIFDPTGKKQLCKPSRGPNSLTGDKVGENYDAVAKAMNKIAAQYPSKNMNQSPVLQDFPSLEEALNISSCDQRLLILNTSTKAQFTESLRNVMGDKEVIGKFHFDSVTKSDGQTLKNAISGQGKKPGLIIVRCGQFGQKGTIIRHIPESATPAQIKAILLASNKTFGEQEKRKNREEHVTKGNELGIVYDDLKPENARTNILRPNGGKKDKGEKGRRKERN